MNWDVIPGQELSSESTKARLLYHHHQLQVLECQVWLLIVMTQWEHKCISIVQLLRSDCLPYFR